MYYYKYNIDNLGSPICNETGRDWSARQIELAESSQLPVSYGKDVALKCSRGFNYTGNNIARCVDQRTYFEEKKFICNIDPSKYHSPGCQRNGLYYKDK